MGNEHTEYDGEVDVPIDAIRILDPQVIAELPANSEFVGLKAHGASFWTRTARLDTKLDGRPVSYFLKTSYGDRGRGMMLGEFTAMNKIRAVAPELVPRPIARGTYSTLDDVHFFLCEFRNMTEDLPHIDVFPAMMTELHRNGTSEDGRFGFPVTTYHGNIPIDHGWSDTWEEYFTRTTRLLLDKEREVQGPDERLDGLIGPFFDKVVPRLLRPLETGGRSIRPSLIHGDLWHGNASMDGDTEKPLIFDAASFYAHNEYELGVWRQPWNKLKQPYRKKYWESFPKSEPKEDFDHRNALYATRVNVLDSILYKGEDSYRQMLIDNMTRLVEMFPGGYEEWEKEQQGKMK